MSSALPLASLKSTRSLLPSALGIGKSSALVQPVNLSRIGTTRAIRSSRSLVADLLSSKYLPDARSPASFPAAAGRTRGQAWPSHAEHEPHPDAAAPRAARCTSRRGAGRRAVYVHVRSRFRTRTDQLARPRAAASLLPALRFRSRWTCSATTALRRGRSVGAISRAGHNELCLPLCARLCVVSPYFDHVSLTRLQRESLTSARHNYIVDSVTNIVSLHRVWTSVHA